MPSAPTMVCPSPPLMDCFCSPSSRYGFSLLAAVKASASTFLPYPGGEELVSSVGHPTVLSLLPKASHGLRHKDLL